MRNFGNRLLCVLSLLILLGCSGLEQSEQGEIRRRHLQGERIYRSSQDTAYPISDPIPQAKDPYPWQKTEKYPPITKENFHCKGSTAHPPHVGYRDSAQPSHYFDCGGRQKHSLPIRNGKEFIYPILCDLLNFVQKKVGAKVIVTCGYRCPIHNAYADASSYNQNSKHMMGAEVDFYVEGFEERPEEIVALLLSYYEGSSRKEDRFLRLKSETLNVATPPWYNEEILIKLYQKEEGRDLDNQHAYPYISIQVRYDKERREKVIYDPKKAFNCYHRY